MKEISDCLVELPNRVLLSAVDLPILVYVLVNYSLVREQKSRFSLPALSLEVLKLFLVDLNLLLLLHLIVLGNLCFEIAVLVRLSLMLDVITA